MNIILNIRNHHMIFKNYGLSSSTYRYPLMICSMNYSTNNFIKRKNLQITKKYTNNTTNFIPKTNTKIILS